MATENDAQADLELCRSVLRGEARAIEAFVERMRCIPRILTLRNRRAPRPLAPEAVADLSQDVFALVWTRLSDFRGEARLEAWVSAFCARKFLEAQRGSRLSQPLADLEPDSGESEELERDDQTRVLSALDALPPDERAVVYEHHFSGSTFDAIGARMGVSVSTVKGRYYRGLDRLRQRLSRAFRGVFDG